MYAALCHVNVIHVIGLVPQIDRVSLIVMELAPGGSLLNFLHSDFGQKTELSLPTILKWAVQIADGLIYLHSQRIIHADLKARNILLNMKLITADDFDRVVLKLANISFFSITTTPTHTAPEIMKNFVGRKSDVWKQN